jgi:hypothetical protein
MLRCGTIAIAAIEEFGGSAASPERSEASTCCRV